MYLETLGEGQAEGVNVWEQHTTTLVDVTRRWFGKAEAEKVLADG